MLTISRMILGYIPFGSILSYQLTICNQGGKHSLIMNGFQPHHQFSNEYPNSLCLWRHHDLEYYAHQWIPAEGQWCGAMIFTVAVSLIFEVDLEPRHQWAYHFRTETSLWTLPMIMEAVRHYDIDYKKDPLFSLFAGYARTNKTFYLIGMATVGLTRLMKESVRKSHYPLTLIRNLNTATQKFTSKTIVFTHSTSKHIDRPRPRPGNI